MAASLKERLARAEATEAATLAILEGAAVRFTKRVSVENSMKLRAAAKRWTNAAHQVGRLRKQLAKESNR